MTVAEILNKAANVIDERGWLQHGFVPDLPDDELDPSTCPVCVLAAINVAAEHNPDDSFTSGIRVAAAVALADHLGMSAALISNSIEAVIGDDWNDVPARTAEQVTAALRKCAAELAEAS